MRSLFGKIFLWFWLAITIVIASLALVTWLYPYSAVPSGTLPDRLHELQVRGAIAVFELHGMDAFEEHREMLDSASRLRTYYLDDAGQELSGKSVPQRLLDFAREHAEELAEGERVMAGQPSRLAIPVTGASGRKYLALVEGGRSGFGQGPGPGGGLRREFGRDGGEFASTQPDGGRGGPDGGRGRGGGGGGDRGPRMMRPPDPAPRFELLVPAHVLLLRLLAMVLAAGLVRYALARYLTSPVRQLQNAARRLASGDLTTRVGPRLAARRDEIGELGRDFDRMAGRVETLLTTQRRLLQDVSHELRSPLARLNVALELAAREAGPPAAASLARVGREAERLNELISQLLTLARLEGAAAQPPEARIDLHTLVSEVAEDAEFEAASLDLHVRVTRCDACAVAGEPRLLRSAIENVVRNAVNHTAEGSEIEVSLTLDSDNGQTAVLEIRDHGPGVPEASLPKIFEPFYRVSDARERTSGGVGLGLAITERAIRLHGGTVQAENAPGGGLLVRIMLPLAQEGAKFQQA